MSGEPVEVRASFENRDWEAETFSEAPDAPALGRSSFTKQYAGEIQGTAVVQMLATRGDGGAGYVAMERTTGSVAGRPGSFVIQHGGLIGPGGADSTSFGSVVPGSGTGDLAGITDEAEIGHGEDGKPFLVLRYVV